MIIIKLLVPGLYVERIHSFIFSNNTTYIDLSFKTIREMGIEDIMYFMYKLGTFGNFVDEQLLLLQMFSGYISLFKVV